MKTGPDAGVAAEVVIGPDTGGFIVLVLVEFAVVSMVKSASETCKQIVYRKSDIFSFMLF